MNKPVPVMLAHGEQMILPALLLIAGLVFIVYPGAFWVVAHSRDRSHRHAMVAWAVLLTSVCGGGAVATIKDFTLPPQVGESIGFLIWAIPAACGVVGLLKVTGSAKRERDLSN